MLRELSFTTAVLHSELGPGLEAFAVVVLAVAAAACYQDARLGGEGKVEVLIVELPWVSQQNAPFLVAATVFTLQALVTTTALCLVRVWQEFSQEWGHRFLRCLKAHASLSLFAAIVYGTEYFSTTHLVARHPVYGDHLIFRNLHWLFVTPWQWFIYASLCTTASASEIWSIAYPTVALHILALLMLLCTLPSLRFVCFGFSSLCEAIMFQRVFALHRLPEMYRVSSFIGRWKFGLWTAYPVVCFLRMLDCISGWSEQVVLYTILDVSTKALTLSLIVAARCAQFISNINGTLQLVLSSNDLTLVVNDEWEILEGPQALPIVAHYLGNVSAKSLLHLCSGADHEHRLCEAARLADSQRITSTATTPKCIISFVLPTGKEMLTECMVSKAVEGSRMVGMTVTGFRDAEDDAFDHHSKEELSTIYSDDGVGLQPVDEMQVQQPVLYPRAPLESDMQVSMGIHNCCEYLQMSGRMRQDLLDVFTQTSAMSALYIWDSDVDPLANASVVVVSPLLRMLLFAQLQIPTTFDNVVDSGTLQSISTALTLTSLVMYQRTNVVLRNGVTCRLTVLPLQGLSPNESEGKGMQPSLHACVFELMAPETPGVVAQNFWFHAGTELTCVQTDGEHYVGPPIPLVGMQKANSFTGWYIFFKVPVGKGEEDQSFTDRLILARPSSEITNGFFCNQLFTGLEEKEVLARLEVVAYKESNENPIPSTFAPLLQNATPPPASQEVSWLVSPRSSISVLAAQR
mmetsp:Transcript_51934/g.121576  ORF Transcript_51934/g.121576 Transcript_51934/m.121576 type:complete len:745 (+) Transcript_51934:50-2284(+)